MGEPKMHGPRVRMRTAIFLTMALISARLTFAQTNFVGIGGNQVTSDSAGNVYVAATEGSLPFPFESPANGVAVITKFDTQGNVMYAYPFAGLITALAVSPQGYLVFTSGSTIDELDVSGNLLYTTTIETAVAGVPTTQINALALDTSGNVYVTGATTSGAIPGTTNGFQTTGPPATTTVPASTPTFAFVTILSPQLDNLLHSTYLGSGAVVCMGGSACIGAVGSSSANAITIATDGSVVVAGSTDSNQFPVTPGAFQSVCNCSFKITSGFVTSFKSDLSALNWSTYLGGPGVVSEGTAAEGLAAEPDGSVVVAGETPDPNFPTTPNAFQTALNAQTVGQGFPSNLFISRFGSTGAIVFSTYLGGSIAEQFGSLELDSGGNPWVTGTTQSPDFPLLSGSPRLGSGFLVGLSSDGTKLVQTQTFPSGAAGKSFTFLPGSEVAVLGSDLIEFPLSATGAPAILGIASATGTSVTNQVAPGELISIFGLNLGPAQGVSGTFDSTGQLPTTLGGVQVLGSAGPLPLLYVSANQINTVAPFDATVPETFQVSGPSTSAMVAMQSVVSDPSVFNSGAINGIPEAVAINQDGSLNSAANPAAPGSTVAIWVNGAGAFQGGGYADGSQVQSDLINLNAPVEVLFDSGGGGAGFTFGFQSMVTYAGGAPGLVAGVAQVNFQIPTDLPTPSFATFNLLVGQNFSPEYSIAIQ